jgi:sugar phosphate isomerase/epimerase
MHPACTGGCTFLSTLDEALEVVDQVNSQHVLLSFDTYHMGVGSEGLTRLSQLAKKIAIVHLADGHPPDDDQHRTPLGRGCVPLKEIVATLRSGGYDGDFDVELFGDDIAPDTYESLLRETQTEFARITAA